MASPVMVLAALLVVASAGATALQSNNLAYLSPVAELPQLAEAEPADAAVTRRHARQLLQTARNGAATVNTAMFAQGVASGDPFVTSVILWTRVTPPVTGTATLDWAMSTNKAFTNIVAQGTLTTSASVDYTAKVAASTCTGCTGLVSNTKYYFQWRYVPASGTPQYSVIGRTRTLPTPTGNNLNVKLSFFGCSNLPQAYFTVYGQIARMADAGNIDYHIHTGDYIYEYATAGNSNLPAADQTVRTHQPTHEVVTLSDYRTRYNQYNSDVDLQAMRASAPLIPIWDDHEYANDAWTGGAQNHQPATEGTWADRKLAALTVYYEQMPIRQANVDNKQQIYRSFDIGKLVKLIMLDTRIIGRDLQNLTLANDPTRTILGAPQKQYLKDTLTAASTAHTWKIIGQQVLFSHRCDSPSADQWDGYRQDQRDILAHISTNNIQNTIILTGDIHSHWALDVPANPCPNEAGFNYNAATGAGSVAVEFVSSAVTSAYAGPNVNRTTVDATEAKIKAANPHVKFQESGYKGFAVLNVTQTAATSTWYYAPSLWVPGQYTNQITGDAWTTAVNTNHLVKVR